MLSRRHFLATGAAAALSTPAIVRAPTLMRIRGILLSDEIPHHGFCDRLRVHLYLQPIQAGLLRGRSISEIAVELNTRGRRGINGGRWNVDDIVRVIKADEFIRDCDRRRKLADLFQA